MKLAQLLAGVEVTALRGDVEVEVSAVTADSRLVTPGALFVAIRGLQQDGSKFIQSAAGKGASAIVTERSPQAEAAGSTTAASETGGGGSSRGEGVAVPATVETPDARAALALIAANFNGRPADRLSLVGVTGTSGKTTTAKMIESVFDATGEPAGLIGTIEYRAGDERLLADRTTPDAVILHEWFGRMVSAGVRHAVMEVSSHALALERTYGLRFEAAVFTNLSRDHFDFHKDFEDYYAAKRILFDQIDRSRRSAIVNIDDQYGRRLAHEMGSAVVTYGREPAADIHPGDGFEISVRGLEGVFETPWGTIEVASTLLGAPNLYNWMGAVGAALAVGIEPAAVEQGIRALTTVRGRFERVPSTSGPTVIVDYAHKPDALEKLLHAVRGLAPERRIVLVFGCGGDRDKGKRALMGRIAADLADHTIITSDNPRGELPEAIVAQIEEGFAAGGAGRFERVLDRREAIAHAVGSAAADDVVLIAGKGHENYQVIGDRIIHFDDREEAEVALKKYGKKESGKAS
jgi:UDP-N-acetylmuramoyl-L-alanyl-D-glutamate--2,6-diaminopimelate ligase